MNKWIKRSVFFISIIGVLVYYFLYPNIGWGECFCDAEGNIEMCWDGYTNRLYFILNDNVCYEACCKWKGD